jgi:hypothetical protein
MRHSPGSATYNNPMDGYEMIFIHRGEAIFGTGPDDPYLMESSNDKEKHQFKADLTEFFIDINRLKNE